MTQIIEKIKPVSTYLRIKFGRGLQRIFAGGSRNYSYATADKILNVEANSASYPQRDGK